jgi:hypothetical protein
MAFTLEASDGSLEGRRARRLYERIGFVTVGEGEHEFEMVLNERSD